MITRRTLAKSLAATPVVAMTLQMGAHGSSWQVARAQEGPVRIGSKDFTEQLILGEMYALLLENAGITTETRLNLGGTEVAQAALLAGECRASGFVRCSASTRRRLVRGVRRRLVRVGRMGYQAE